MKKLFYLPFKVKLNFFKTFLLPHFDYCASLFIYFKKTLLDKLERNYNSCLFNLLNLSMDIDSISQQTLLTPYNLLTFYNIDFCFVFHNFLLK